MNDERQISRRRVLETLGAVAVLSCTGCFVGGGSAAKLTGPIAGGTLTDYPVGSLKAVPGGEALAVGRDADGLYALSTICTHSECDMTTDGTIDASGTLVHVPWLRVRRERCGHQGTGQNGAPALRGGAGSRRRAHRASLADGDGNGTHGGARHLRSLRRSLHTTHE